jgi:hypothetical protein
MIHRSIPLPRGGSLEVDLTEDFLEIVRKHFELKNNVDVSDDHVRMYIWGSFKNALDKAELEGHLQ